MMQLERQRREFEEKMEKDRKKFELELDKRNQQERKRTDIIMIVLAVAAIIFAILQLTSDSWVVQYFQGIAGMVK